VDPVVARPLRPEAASGRAGTAGREPNRAFDAMLDAPPPETPRPAPSERRARAERQDRSARAERHDQVSDDRGDSRARPSSARDTDRSEASGRNQTKSADAPTTRQAKDGQPSNDSPQAADKAAASEAPAQTDAGPAQGTDIAANAAATLEAALVSAEGDAPASAKSEDKDKTAAAADADGGDETDAKATGDAKPADAVVVAVAVAVQAPTTPVGTSDPATKPTIAPVEGGAGTTPALPTDTATAGEPAARDAATSPAKEATPKIAGAAAEAGIKDAAAEPQTVAPPSLSETADKKSPAERKADTIKGKSNANGRTGVAPGERTLQGADTTPAGNSGDAESKPVAAHQARTQSAEPGSVARTPSADARADITAPAPNAAPAGNPPIMPFNLAVSASLPTPTLWSTTALRVDAADNAVPIAGVAVEIVSRAQDGLRRFDIRLDPPELGRIDVRLDVDDRGKVTSHLVVDRTETLDLLRRDAPQLERALQHAGLSTEGGMQFSLRDQSFAGRDQTPRDGANISQLIVPDDELAAAEAVRRGYGRMVGLGGGVDIKV
jgi:chemotaxis protein MotD